MCSAARTLQDHVYMAITPSDAIALTAVHDEWLPDLLRSAGYAVFRSNSGEEICEVAAQAKPDVVLIDPLMIDDMSATDLCRRLHSDPAITRHLPVLILFDGPPTPELRVAALRVGAWDFLSPSAGKTEILLKLATYVEAKRKVSEAVDDGLIDPSSGFRSLPGLARRARELAALMTRVSGPFSCLVIEVEGRASIRDLGGVVARAARISDVVGDLGTNRMGILAPGTTGAGAIRLAKRISEAVTEALASRDPRIEGNAPVSFAAGFDIVANVKYNPIDPFELLQRAAFAVRNGKPTAELAWVRRYADVTIDRRSTPPATSGASAALQPPPDGVRP